MEQKKFDQAIAELDAWIQEAQHIVFFGGAGVSTASGIPGISAARTDCTTSTMYALNSIGQNTC